MKRVVPHIGIALLAFVVGTIAATLWKSHHSPSQNTRSQASGVITPVVEEWPLTNQIVSRSLQSHSFRSDKLRRNSNDEIVWRWLKESIAGYPQNWVKLNISDSESYGVVLYPLKVLESTELKYYNKELSEKRVAPSSRRQTLPSTKRISGQYHLSKLVRIHRCRRSKAGLFCRGIRLKTRCCPTSCCT